jgi:hypothetical protein
MPLAEILLSFAELILTFEELCNFPTVIFATFFFPVKVDLLNFLDFSEDELPENYTCSSSFSYSVSESLDALLVSVWAFGVKDRLNVFLFTSLLEFSTLVSSIG